MVACHPSARFILTGAPGAGKTAIVEELSARGVRTIPEAATDVIAERQAAGHVAPWQDADFVDRVAALQRDRQQAADKTGPVQIYDRSPVCTLALARYLGRPVTPGLAAELRRITSEKIYQRRVFFVQPLGFIVPTPARTISLDEALAFGTLHQQIYTSLGYELVPVPPGEIAQRADLVEEYVDVWMRLD